MCGTAGPRKRGPPSAAMTAMSIHTCRTKSRLVTSSPSLRLASGRRHRVRCRISSSQRRRRVRACIGPLDASARLRVGVTTSTHTRIFTSQASHVDEHACRSLLKLEDRCSKMRSVQAPRIELGRVTPLDSKSSASTSSATLALQSAACGYQKSSALAKSLGVAPWRRPVDRSASVPWRASRKQAGFRSAPSAFLAGATRAPDARVSSREGTNEAPREKA